MKTSRLNLASCLMAALLGLSACTKGKKLPVPALGGAWGVIEVQLGDLPEYAPAHGIAKGSGSAQTFEVNVEAQDSPRVQAGQMATAYVAPGSKPIPCKVTRILRSVSQETGQAIAWLKPLAETSVPSGEFIYSMITMGIRHKVLLAPQAAILIRGGKTWVIKQEAGEKGDGAFSPVEVKLGASSDAASEVKSGFLSPGDRIVSEGGIGFLYPGFKRQAEGD